MSLNDMSLNVPDGLLGQITRMPLLRDSAPAMSLN